MTHDYVRNGTTSLWAACDIGPGSVITQHYRKHWHQEFVRSLKLIDRAVPKNLDVDVVLDNYATPGSLKCDSGCRAIPASTRTSRPPALRE